MDKNVAINNICRATGLAAQIGAFVAILKFKKPRLGLAMSAAGDLVYWAPAVADKKDPTLRHELGIICSTPMQPSSFRTVCTQPKWAPCPRWTSTTTLTGP